MSIRRILLPPVFIIVLAGVAADFGHRPQPLAVDFHTYLAAARVGLEQGWSHLYDQGLVAAQQISLVPGERAQPFLSPPPVAWLAAAFVGLPFGAAYILWAIVTIGALAMAVAWSAADKSLESGLAAAFVIAPVWVLQAAYLGQVVPLVAAAIVVAWRLLRDRHDIAAGLILVLLLVKPNTAFLVPVVLLASGRRRTFFIWLLGSATVAVAVFSTAGVQVVATYIGELRHPPPGTDAVALQAALGVSGLAALAISAAILAVVLGAAWKLRESLGLVMVLGVIGSLLTTPYLHVCDLCLLGAAGWIVWEERPTLIWRAALAASWLVASPFVDFSGLGPTQNRWPVFELAWLTALLASAYWIGNNRMVYKKSVDVDPDLGGCQSGLRQTGRNQVIQDE